MKNRKAKTVEQQKRETKRLFLCVVIMALICATLGISVLVYYFAPRDHDTYILTVSSFVGMDESKITAYDGLQIKREWVYSDEVARGRVISQSPYANARRKLRRGNDCDVTLYISLGQRTEKIPRLEGVDGLSAAAALRSIGARVRSVAIYGDGEDGVVLGTSPRYDVEITEGQVVTIFVSRRRVKEPVCVPSFIGMDKSEAVRFALSQGLYIGYIEELGEGECVTEQSIPEGATVKHGSYISFKTGVEVTAERAWPPFAEQKTKEDG